MSGYALQLDHITKAFQDGAEKHVVLRDISLQVQEGEFAAVVGPSGSGKSTLLAIAGMMLSPDAGTVCIGGMELSSKKQKEWTKLRREHIGFIFQSHQLLPYLKAEEQLTLFLPKGKGGNLSVPDLMERLGILGCKNQYPAQMSGGEKQRVAIARAFVGNPDLILADEPTASLDGERGRQAVDMIRGEVRKQKKAAVMVTHDERVLDLVDTVYRLENGILSKNG
jgi:putative ABC transport system ATP-binding protein